MNSNGLRLMHLMTSFIRCQDGCKGPIGRLQRGFRQICRQDLRGMFPER